MYEKRNNSLQMVEQKYLLCFWWSIVFFSYYIYLQHTFCYLFILISYMAVYGPYRYLFAKDTEGIITKFISRERPLQDYVAAIERLKKMASEIASLPVYVPMHLFLLDCSKLNQVNEINSCGCLYFSQLFKRKFIIKYCIVSDS